MSELLDDLEALPLRVRRSARLTTGDREVMWRRADAVAAIEALAAAEKVVLGLEVRRYLPDGRFSETAWSDLTGGYSNDPNVGCAAALAALARLDSDGDLDGHEWVLVTW